MFPPSGHRYEQARWRPGVVYRVLRSNPPTRLDIENNIEKQARLGRPFRPRDLRHSLIAEGISVFEERSRAEAEAQNSRGRIGAYVAEVVIAENAVIMELTGAKGHWTLWENLDVLLNQMRDIRPVPGLGSER